LVIHPARTVQLRICHAAPGGHPAVKHLFDA
jgi:hypothetical protein